MKSFDVHGAGRALMLFLLGLLTYLLAARGLSHQPVCPNTLSGNGSLCVACPLQGECVAVKEAR